MVDIRIYRAALLPVVLALVILMFSVQERPAPLSSALAPDAFDAKGPYADLREFVADKPDRRAGSPGDAALADLVQSRLRSLSGVETTRDDFRAKVDGESVRMTNVVGILSGPSERQLVVIAPRDSVKRPGASSAGDTAVLLELAKALAGVRHTKTIVFVSADGAGSDDAGVRRFASSYQDRSLVEAVLVLEDVTAADARRPYLVPWSTDERRGSLQLLRTANVALERELGSGSGSESALGQFVRLAWPLTLREQGPLVEAGLDAITLTAHGEVPAQGKNTLDATSRSHLLQFGKAALATMLAVDSAPELERSPRSYISFGRNLLPGWAVSLVAFALLAPVLAGALDGVARARRRGRVIGHWTRWVLAASLPFALTFGAAYVFELLGWLPKTASEALAPASRPSFAESAPALAGLALLFAIAWIFLRPFVFRWHRLERPDAPEAALALAFVLSLELLLLWGRNPFAVLLLVPAAHLCLLCALPERPSRPLVVGGMLGAVLLLPALVLVYYGVRFDLGFDPSRYALLFIAGGGSLVSVVLISLIAGSVLSSIIVALARRGGERTSEITIRGPRTYAGPGSLGGTESALSTRRGR